MSHFYLLPQSSYMSYEVVLPEKYESSYPSKIQNKINNGQKNKIKGKPWQIYHFICDVYSFRNMVQAKYTIFFKLNILFLKLFTFHRPHSTQFHS